MSNYNYALLLDNLYPTDQNKLLIQHLNKFSNYEIVIFLLSKENILPNNFPVFSISDYFNFNGVSIASNNDTLEKMKRYPARGPKIVVGINHPDFISVDKLDFDLIEKTLKEREL